MHDKRVALVTGANQGIGLQIARDLAAKNFTVLVGSRDLARGEEAAKTIVGDARALQLDVTDRASIAAASERIRKKLGRLDVLVNNAAISNTRKKQLGLSLQEYAKLSLPSRSTPSVLALCFEHGSWLGAGWRRARSDRRDGRQRGQAGAEPDRSGREPPRL
jgi:NAD(P)-dependent dehydrogenase (short-subunit alcohol dehydrogenase family)